MQHKFNKQYQFHQSESTCYKNTGKANEKDLGNKRTSVFICKDSEKSSIWTRTTCKMCEIAETAYKVFIRMNYAFRDFHFLFFSFIFVFRIHSNTCTYIFIYKFCTIDCQANWRSCCEFTKVMN